MDFLFAAVVFGIFVLISMGIKKGKNDDELLAGIRSRWGRLPGNTHNAFDFRRVSVFFRKYGEKHSRHVIDDTTWNDLEMDRFYPMINSTHTSMGDEVLYSLLRTPLYDKESMDERLRLIQFWEENPEARERVQLLLEKFGKRRDKGASMLIDGAEQLAPRKGKLYTVLTFIPLLCLPVVFVDVMAGLLLLVAVAGLNILYHERSVNEIDSKVAMVDSALSIINLADKISRLDAVEIPGVTSRLKELLPGFREITKKGMPFRIKRRYPDEPSILLKLIFLTDIWAYQASVLKLRERLDEFALLFETVGLVDATICVASYRQAVENWCVPGIEWENDGDACIINAKEVRHPLIRDCVPNPVMLKKPLLITGSNASGKSTYLKTVAINTLMAHTIGTCLAESWTSVPLFPITSMALSDSVVSGESYFIAEIKSLKRIFSAVNPEVKCLCIVDEALRGTNTVERIAASSRILYYLARQNVSLVAATHDQELAEILDGIFENKHFEGTVTDTDVAFDYRIREGRCTTRNAISLLQLMGFEPGIISDCISAVSGFEATGSWGKIEEN